MSTTTKQQIWPQNQKLHECLDSKPPTEEHKRQQRKKYERKPERLSIILDGPITITSVEGKTDKNHRENVGVNKIYMKIMAAAKPIY